MPRSRFLWIAGICTVTYVLTAWVLYLTLSPQPRASLRLRDVKVHGFAPSGEFVTLDCDAGEVTRESGVIDPRSIAKCRSLRTWNPYVGEHVASYSHPEGLDFTDLEFSTDGKKLALWSEAEGKLRVLSRVGRELVCIPSGTTTPRAFMHPVLRFTSDGSAIVYATRTGAESVAIEVFDLNSLSVRATCQLPDDPWQIGNLSPRLDLLARHKIPWMEENKVREISLYSLLTGEKVASLLDCVDQDPSISFSLDGNYVVAACSDSPTPWSAESHSILMWHVTDKTLTRTMSDHEFLGFLDGGRILLARARAGSQPSFTLTAFAFPSFRELWTMDPRHGAREVLARYPTLSSGRGGYFAVPLECASSLRAGIEVLNKSLDASLATSAANVRIFEAQTGCCVATIKSPNDELFFAPDDKTLAVVAHEEDVTLVDFYDLPLTAPWLRIGLWPLVLVTLVFVLTFWATGRKGRARHAA